MKIEVLSRFRTPSQVRNIIKELESGAIDLIIGTPAFAEDIKFRKLGFHCGRATSTWLKET